MSPTTTVSYVQETNELGRAFADVLKQRIRDRYPSQNEFFRVHGIDKRNFWTIAENKPQLTWIFEVAALLDVEPAVLIADATRLLAERKATQ
jgi:hypothetical protein